eukprot:Nk52_evm50s2367 gene=Nk52_evmTU50s2367
MSFRRLVILLKKILHVLGLTRLFSFLVQEKEQKQKQHRSHDQQLLLERQFSTGSTLSLGSNGASDVDLLCVESGGELTGSPSLSSLSGLGDGHDQRKQQYRDNLKKKLGMSSSSSSLCSLSSVGSSGMGNGSGSTLLEIRICGAGVSTAGVDNRNKGSPVSPPRPYESYHRHGSDSFSTCASSYASSCHEDEWSDENGNEFLDEESLMASDDEIVFKMGGLSQSKLTFVNDVEASSLMLPGQRGRKVKHQKTLSSPLDLNSDNMSTGPDDRVGRLSDTNAENIVLQRNGGIVNGLDNKTFSCNKDKFYYSERMLNNSIATQFRMNKDLNSMEKASGGRRNINCNSKNDLCSGATTIFPKNSRIGTQISPRII